MRRWLAVFALLLAWALWLGAASCGGIKPPKPPQPPTACPPTCPLGTACTTPSRGCQPIPPPGPVCEVGVEHCACWVMPPETGAWEEARCGEGQVCTAERQCVADTPPPPVPVCPPCPMDQYCPSPSVGCVPVPPGSPCPATCPQGTACADPTVGCVPTPPPPSGCSIDGEPGPVIPGYRPQLGGEVNAAMAARSGCEPGSRCVVPETRQEWQAKVVAEIKRRGLCAGQHSPTTDEIAAATSVTAPREGWHIYAGPWAGPGTVVWAPGAARPAYEAPGGPPPIDPPPVAGCPAPAVPKVAMWGLTYRNRWWDCTPKFSNGDSATWTGQPVTRYCAAIGMPDRLYCPARPEGNPDRRDCEGVGIGGYAAAVPLWRCEVGQAEVNESNPFQARCAPGWVEVCATDGTNCTRSR